MLSSVERSFASMLAAASPQSTARSFFLAVSFKFNMQYTSYNICEAPRDFAALSHEGAPVRRLVRLRARGEAPGPFKQAVRP